MHVPPARLLIRVRSIASGQQAEFTMYYHVLAYAYFIGFAQRAVLTMGLPCTYSLPCTDSTGFA